MGENAAPTLSARTQGGGGLGTDTELDGGLVLDVAATLTAGEAKREGFDASEEGCGRGTPVVAFAENSRHELRLEGGDGQRTGSLSTGGGKAGQGVPCVAFPEAQTGVRKYDTAGTLRSEGPGHDPVGTRVHEGMSVRRLTPIECSRLQGFPDDYTLIPWRGKPASKCPDGPRYKALGNSWAVPVVRWIGERIEMFEFLNFRETA